MEGVTALKVETVTTFWEIKRKIDPITKRPYGRIIENKIDTTSETTTYELSEVTPEQLLQFRKNKTPSFVLKIGGTYFHTIIPRSLSLLTFSLLGTHMCSDYRRECRRLSAASNENGGCAKVRNKSRRIELYPWITIGYETFNTTHDVFSVINCTHYEQCPPRKKYTLEEMRQLKLSLAEFAEFY